MEFYETSIFTREVDALLTREELRALQNFLLRRPSSGSLIVGGGGVRKLRFGHGATGKRGGVRVIYHHHDAWNIIFLLLIYEKGRKDDLNDAQVAQLRKLVKKEFA